MSSFMFMQLRVLIVLICFIFRSPSLSAQQIEPKEGDLGYVVRGVRGEVLIRDSLAVGWRPVKLNQFLRDQALLQVSNGAFVMLQRSGRSKEGQLKALAGVGSELRISTPMVARLGDGLIRPIKFSKNFIQNEFQDAVAEEKDQNKNIFAESWQRTVDFMTFKLNKPKIEVKDPKISGELDVVFPSKSPFFEMEKGSLDVDISWIDKQKNKSSSYRVYAWKKGDDKGKSVGLSSSNRFSLSVNEPGEYMVQVETADGNVLSKPVELYVGEDLTKKQQKNGVNSDKEELVKLLMPGDSHVFTSTENQVVPIRFSWRYLSDGLPPLVLVIKRGVDVIYQESVDSQLSATVALPAGVYSWFVKKQSMSLSNEVFSEVSDVRKFTVRQMTSMGVQSALKDGLHQTNKITMFVDEW